MTTKAAHYRFEVRTISRGQRAGGRSIVACAAYRSGASLKDTRIGKRFNYASRKNDIAFTGILAPEDAPVWMHDPQKLFNAVEAASPRKDARLAREFIPSLPVQLDEAQQIALTLGFVKDELVSRGMVAQVSIHRSEINPHPHILCVTRKVDGDGFGKVRRDWNDVQLLKELRQAWADHVNAALEAAGCPERVDHRSLADRGIERIPQPKIGVAATAMQKRGVDTERHAQVREVEVRNAMLPAVRSIQACGRVTEFGMGATPWERWHYEDENAAPRAPLPPALDDLPKGDWVRYIGQRHQQQNSRGSLWR